MKEKEVRINPKNKCHNCNHIYYDNGLDAFRCKWLENYFKQYIDRTVLQKMVSTAKAGIALVINSDGTCLNYIRKKD